MSPPIVIESIIRRSGGSEIELADGTIYRFRPVEAANGAHLAMVRNPDHIGTFLGIREGYRLYVPPATPAFEEVPVIEAVDDAAAIEKAVTARGVAKDDEPADATAPADAGDAPAAAPPSPTDGEGANPEGAGSGDAGHSSDAPPLDTLSDDALRDRYETALGRKPHPNARRDTMIAAITAPKGTSGGA